MFANDCCTEVNSLRAVVVVVGDDHVRTDHRVGLLQLLGRLEPRAVDLERRQQRIGREVRGERVRQSEHRCELRTEEARAEDPERHPRAGAGRRAHELSRLRLGEVALQLDDVLREGVGARRVASERVNRQLVGAGRTAETEVDPSRMQRLERSELLGDHDRRMVRQHDPARADAHRLRSCRDVRDHDGGRRARDPDRVVMLGEPEPVVPPPFDVLREVERVSQRLARRCAFDDRREIENGERRKRHDLQECPLGITLRGGDVCAVRESLHLPVQNGR